MLFGQINISCSNATHANSCRVPNRPPQFPHPVSSNNLYDSLSQVSCIKGLLRGLELTAPRNPKPKLSRLVAPTTLVRPNGYRDVVPPPSGDPKSSSPTIYATNRRRSDRAVSSLKSGFIANESTFTNRRYRMHPFPPALNERRGSCFNVVRSSLSRDIVTLILIHCI